MCIYDILFLFFTQRSNINTLGGYKMKYGYFDDKFKEYVITNPKTPVKWVNYVGGLSFGGLIDQTGGSLICKGDPATNRIVKYIPQLPSSDFKGETMYIRVKEKTGYKLFSPYFVPTLDQYDFYECRVGMGYSTYVSEFYGIKTEVKVFVPEGETRVIRDIKITNNREDKVEIDIIPVVEYTHFNAIQQFDNADWVPQTMMSEIRNEELGMKTLLQYAFMRKDFAVNYFTSNHSISSFESDRKIFLGDNEYGTFRNPLSLMNEELSNHEAKRGDNIAALLHHLGVIESGDTKRVITQLGQCESYENELDKINFFRNEDNVDKAFDELKEYWDNLLGRFVVDTPDKAMNSIINIFNPRQCNTTMNWSRYLSLYQLGLGARGIGFRDSSQDVLGVVSHTPIEAKELIKKLLSVQKIDGSAMHQFNPLSMIANEGDSREMDDRDDFYGDDHLWIIQSVTAYIKETGDVDFLDEIIPFYDKDKYEQVIESGTVLEHLKRSLQFTKENIGKHKLPLLGFADWNDTVNLPKGAESIFNANLYGKGLLEMIELFNYLKNDEQVKEYSKDYQSMKKIVNDTCWDGEWYVRYYDEQGYPIGSYKNSEGQIYTNAQTWTVISGFADQDRAKQSLESVNNKLNTSKGIKLSYPGYDGYDSNKGGVTTYPPGAKENGGIFLHSNPWVMIAETMVGNGDRAFEYYNQINPATRNDSIDEFECEPYVYPQNILGDEHPEFGLGRNSWLSGTASWTYQAGVKYILGILPTYNGLQINPCIPSTWKEFKVKKYYREATYDIKVMNPDMVQKGVKKITVDGLIIKGNIVPIFSDNKNHIIEVIMG